MTKSVEPISCSVFVSAVAVRYSSVGERTGACGAEPFASQPGETWRQLTLWRSTWHRDAPGYVISSHGRVGRLGVEPGQGRRQTGDYLLNPTWSKGTAYVGIAGKMWTLSRLVAYAFNGPPPATYVEVGFRDGDHENFRPDNLAWLRVESDPATRGRRKWRRTNA